MAEYRRDKTSRILFRIEKESGLVRKVSNKMNYVAIQDYRDAMFAEEALLDYLEATQEQFESAFKNARDRILLDML